MNGNNLIEFCKHNFEKNIQYIKPDRQLIESVKYIFQLKLNFTNFITNYRYEYIVMLRYTDTNLPESDIVLIMTWMVRLSVSTNDGLLVTFGCGT